MDDLYDHILMLVYHMTVLVCHMTCHAPMQVARARESKFGSHKVEEIFREEQLKTLKVLNSNLDQLSLSGPTAHSPALQRKNKQ